MAIRFPRPLRPGDRIGVTSPSSGVAERFQPRLEFAVSVLRSSGFEVEAGHCMDGSSHVSAPAADRAAELNRMLTDPAIRAVIPPWGGETAIDLLPLLDCAAIEVAEPTWFVGYSDTSTIMLPLTVRAGLATLHGCNLMDTPLEVPWQLMSWTDIAAQPSGATFTQESPGEFSTQRWLDFAADPAVSRPHYDGRGSWTRLDGTEPVDVTGRLIGGCIEAVSPLAGAGTCCRSCRS